jgi:hypothetical protein
MPWFKVDDSFDSHPKVVTAGLRSIGLWVKAGPWCARLLTDGFVPVHMLRVWGATKRDAAGLVSAGLWDAVEGGYQFHDWHEYQPTSSQVKDQRKATAERVARWRNKHKGDGQDDPNDGARNGVTHGDGNGVTGALVTPLVTQPHVTQPPTRPDPTRSTSALPEITTGRAQDRSEGPEIHPESAARSALRLLPRVCPEHRTEMGKTGVCSGCRADELAGAEAVQA